MALLWVACSPISASEKDGDVPGGDAGSGVIRDDAGKIISFTQATVHVAGLLGAGLTLTLDGTQELDVPSDGIWKVPLAAPVATLFMSVAQQPVDPHQRCDVTKIDDNVFTVTCRDQTWNVGGTIEGYEGKGLKLALYGTGADQVDGTPYSVFNAATPGEFTFNRALADDTNYEVRVLEQPTGPRQDCALENADGTAEGSDITDVKVTCTTKTYVFTSVITGLQGRGLMVNAGGTPYPIDNPGTTTYSDYLIPDGFRYKIEIVAQPKNPEQLCFIEGGEGVVDGANVTYTIVCGAANNVRVAEIGACPYSNSSCWFEVYNVGSEPENLAFYKLRTSAISPTAFVPSRVFALPSFAIPAFGRVVIQGKTAGALADGQGVYHVGDGDTVPWWGADGFLELLNPNGATADFVR